MAVCRGAFFAGPQRIELRDFDLPPRGPTDVLLRVVACGVCGSDLHQFHGRWPRPEVVPGHEIGGVVLEVGADATAVQVGDRVAVEPIIRCGDCRYCRTGRYLLCATGQFISVDVHGGFADRMVVPAYCCHRLEGETDPALGALAEPLSVGLHAVRIAEVNGDDTVLVLGAGTIGLMTVAAARAMGAGKIIVTAKHPHQHTAAERFGADVVLEPGEGVAEEVKAICPEGPDIVVETVGTVGGVIQQALDVVRKLGTVVLIGGITEASALNLKPIIFNELRVLGSPCYGQVGVTQDFAIAADLISRGAVGMASLISARYPLAQIQQAFLAAGDKQSGAIKVLVEP
jgi:2-desacetyl-2-hydroxyethyl bacteriochlorophyllide A dehydrogenase